MLPSVAAASLQDAFARFDRELRPLPGWSHWEDNRAHKYAIRAAGQIYPVKQVISLATGVPVSDFSSGEGSTQANDYARSPGPPGKESKEIAEVSTTLNRLAAALGVAHENTYRNANGVYMKLMNFRRLDPAYQPQSKVGLTRGGKGEEIIWEEFASDPGRCHRVADGIRAGIEAAQASPVPPSEDDLDDGIEAEDGRLLTALYRRRERSRTLVDKKKAKVLAGQQRLSCEVCGFYFAATYGERGVGFIECHHTRPVSEAVGQKTRLADLALLCANCHRMIHARRLWVTVDQLRALLHP